MMTNHSLFTSMDWSTFRLLAITYHEIVIRGVSFDLLCQAIDVQPVHLLETVVMTDDVARLTEVIGFPKPRST